jgi:hypothetical protein
MFLKNGRNFTVLKWYWHWMQFTPWDLFTGKCDFSMEFVHR